MAKIDVENLKHVLHLNESDIQKINYHSERPI